MVSISAARIGLAFALLGLAPRAGVAQRATATPGSDADERLRLEEITGVRPLDNSWFRAASNLLGPAEIAPGRPVLLGPEARVVAGTGLPLSLNQGSLWAGVGSNVLLRLGVALRTGPVTFVLAPEVTWSQNRAFRGPDTTLWAVPAGRNPYSSPLYPLPRSADLPWRFGGSAFAHAWWGQSSVTARFGAFAAGVSTEDAWWGPGIRNALVMSDNAPGVPQLFVRTARPLDTPIGLLEGRWSVGTLRQSAYFDTSKGLRSLAAFALVWRPRFEPNLGIGLTRAVYRTAGSPGDAAFRWFDVFRATARGDTGASGAAGPHAEGITGLFARWVFPRAGAEAWAEWARNELPASLRDLLTSPGHSQAYTVGLQWTRPAGTVRWRVQAEVTYAEKDASYRDQSVRAWYTSRVVPQGYTNDGRVVGAAVGPGGSSQWLAADVFAPTWQAGAFLTRIRWDDDAIYDLPDAPPAFNRWCSHDVTVMGGVRGGASGTFGRLTGSAGVWRRLNPWLENYTLCPNGFYPGTRRSVSGLTVELRYAPPGL